MFLRSANTIRSNPPSGFLRRIPASELQLIKVGIRRWNVTTTGPSGPIERSIDDPKQLIPLIHLEKDDSRISKSIFDREGVIVNQEEQFVLADANKLDPPKSRKSRSYSRSKSRSPRNERSTSSNYRRSKSSSPSRSEKRSDKDTRRVLDESAERRKSTDRSRSADRDANRRDIDKTKSIDKDTPGRDLDRRDRNTEHDREKILYRSRLHSRDHEEERYRKRSRTPLRPGEYRPPRSELRRRSRARETETQHEKYKSHARHSRSLSRDRYRKCPSPDHQKPSTSRRPSRSPRRSPSPRRRVDRARSPRYGDPPKGRRSRSPSKPDYVDRRRQEKSPGYKSPEKRRSRSPTKYETERRQRSRSPNRHPYGSRDRSPPGRYDRYPRRHSRSPDRYDSHRGPPDKRSRSSRSPHPPIVTFSRNHDHRRSNRSPGYERDRSYKSDKHRRSRSRSPRKHRHPSRHGDQSDADFAFYEGIPGSEFWIPGPIRAGFPANPRFYPPALYPRIPGAAPLFLPFRNPMMTPYPVFRPRLPVYNSKYKPKATPQIQSGDDAPSTSGAAQNPSSSTGNTGDAVGTQERQDTEAHKDHDGEKWNTDEDLADKLHEKD